MLWNVLWNLSCSLTLFYQLRDLHSNPVHVDSVENPTTLIIFVLPRSAVIEFIAYLPRLYLYKILSASSQFRSIVRRHSATRVEIDYHHFAVGTDKHVRELDEFL